MNDLGKYLVTTRETLGFKKCSDFFKQARLPFSYQFYRSVELGKRKPKLENISLIAEKLQVDKTHLFQIYFREFVQHESISEEVVSEDESSIKILKGRLQQLKNERDELFKFLIQQRPSGGKPYTREQEKLFSKDLIYHYIYVAYLLHQKPLHSKDVRQALGFSKKHFDCIIRDLKRVELLKQVSPKSDVYKAVTEYSYFSQGSKSFNLAFKAILFYLNKNIAFFKNKDEESLDSVFRRFLIQATEERMQQFKQKLIELGNEFFLQADLPSQNKKEKAYSLIVCMAPLEEINLIQSDFEKNELKA